MCMSDIELRRKLYPNIQLRLPQSDGKRWEVHRSARRRYELRCRSAGGVALTNHPVLLPIGRAVQQSAHGGEGLGLPDAETVYVPQIARISPGARFLTRSLRLVRSHVRREHGVQDGRGQDVGREGRAAAACARASDERSPPPAPRSRPDEGENQHAGAARRAGRILRPVRGGVQEQHVGP